MYPIGYAGRARPRRTWPAPRSPDERRRRELVRFARGFSIDLPGDVEVPLEDAPAGHPIPGPARLVLGNRRGLPEDDAAEGEVVGGQRLDLGVAFGPAPFEVRHVPPLVGVDATDGPGDAADERGIELPFAIMARDPRA